MSRFGSTEYYLEVARGNVEGASIINKFGHNPLVPTTGADIWSGLGLYGFYPTSAEDMEIVSSNGNDTSGGTGARTAIIFGLDGSGLEIDETATLNGGTVQLNNTYTAVYRVVITVRISGGGTTAAIVAADDGQTQMTHYTIPAGKTGYFIEGYVALGNDNKNGVDGTFQWMSRVGGVGGAWSVQGQVNLINIGSSHFIYRYGAPAGPLPELTNIKIRVTVADEIIDGIGGYDIIMFDN
jgi:hypothetical protein